MALGTSGVLNIPIAMLVVKTLLTLMTSSVSAVRRYISLMADSFKAVPMRVITASLDCLHVVQAVNATGVTKIADSRGGGGVVGATWQMIASYDRSLRCLPVEVCTNREPPVVQFYAPAARHALIFPLLQGANTLTVTGHTGSDAHLSRLSS